MNFNPDPCKQDENPVHQVKLQKPLGLFLDPKLSFDEHIQCILIKTHKIIGLIRNLQPIIWGHFVKVPIKYINQQKFAISCCVIMKAKIAQMFIITLLTRIKSPLKESESSRLGKCIFLSRKTGETQNMEFLRRPLENVQEIHLTWSWWILPTAERFLHPKLQVFNLITYTVLVSITNWKEFMAPWLVVLPITS